MATLLLQDEFVVGCLQDELLVQRLSSSCNLGEEEEEGGGQRSEEEED